jgi:hypothetical protein
MLPPTMILPTGTTTMKATEARESGGAEVAAAITMSSAANAVTPSGTSSATPAGAALTNPNAEALPVSSDVGKGANTGGCSGNTCQGVGK